MSVLHISGVKVQIDAPYSSFPRVSWIASGWVSLLLLHAAGYHGPGYCQNILACVMSSNTLTIIVLKLTAYDAEFSESQKVMIVAMSETPKQRPL